MMSLVAIYCRVSSDDQADRGTIENQKIFAEKYIDLHQLAVYDWYMDDGVTGTLPLQERPAGKRLLRDAKAGKFDLVLFYKIDRLGRSVRVILNSVYDLQELDVGIRSMTEAFDTTTPAGRFALTAFAGIAELERDNILARMRQGTLRHVEKGKWAGGPVPYGYRLADGYLAVADEPIKGYTLSEADVIRIIFHKIVEEKTSTEKIADYLNSLRIPTKYTILERKVKTSGHWYPSRVLTIAHNTVYYGVHTFGALSRHRHPVKVKQDVPPIISREIWDAAQRQLTANVLMSPRNSKRQYLLRGLIKCGLCGSTYVGTASKNYGGGKTAYYVCNGRARYTPDKSGGCVGKTIRCDWIDDMVWNDCLKYIREPGRILAAAQTTKKPEKMDVKEELALLKSTLDKLTSDRASVISLYRRQIISENDLADQLQQISQEQEDITAQIKEKEEAADQEVDTAAELKSYVAMLEQFQEQLTASPSYENRREIILALLDSIVVHTDFDNGKRDIPLVNIAINYKFPVPENFYPDCKPNGHGFCAATRIKRLGKAKAARTREMLTSPSSKGCRSISKV